MKIIINTCFGGFGLSVETIRLYQEKTGNKPGDDYRTDPVLIEIIEELGSKKAGSSFSELRIIEIPDDVEWEIEEYDGIEWVSEKHRRWG